MTRSGIAFPLLPSVPRISVTGSSPLLPTPTADQKGPDSRRGANAQGGPALTEALSMLPTPTVNDARYLSAPSQEDRNGPGLPTVVRLLPTPLPDEGGTNQSPFEGAAVRPQLGTLIKLLPTPTATLGSAGSAQDRYGFAGQPTLQGAVKLLPTPVKGDATGSRQATVKNPRSDSPTLTDLAWSGALTSPRSGGGSKSTDQPRTLSPAFVGWMMGTPQCTVCGAEWTDPACQHSATAYTSTPPGSSGSTS